MHGQHNTPKALSVTHPSFWLHYKCNHTRSHTPAAAPNTAYTVSSIHPPKLDVCSTAWCTAHPSATPPITTSNICVLCTHTQTANINTHQIIKQNSQRRRRRREKNRKKKLCRKKKIIFIWFAEKFITTSLRNKKTVNCRIEMAIRKYKEWTRGYLFALEILIVSERELYCFSLLLLLFSFLLLFFFILSFTSFYSRNVSMAWHHNVDHITLRPLFSLCLYVVCCIWYCLRCCRSHRRRRRCRYRSHRRFFCGM